MQDKISTYCGWSNYETWIASLWLHNQWELYGYIGEAHRQGGGIFDKASWLESQLREDLHDNPNITGMWADLISATLHRINWVEIIENNQE